MSTEQSPFFGRRPILERILPTLLVHTPASFVLVGARLTGKSALLRHIEVLCLNARTNEDGEHRLRPVLLDCARIQPPHTLWSVLLATLSSARSDAAAPSEPQCPGDDGAAARHHPRMLVMELLAQHQMSILLLDNFDHLLAPTTLALELCTELDALASLATLVLTTQKPLYDVDAALAGSPLVSNSTQLFLGLLDREAALQWLAYQQAGQVVNGELALGLLPSTGRHPFLLHKVGDCLAEVQPMSLNGQAEGGQLLSFLRLRFAEHGRALFLAQWALLHDPPAIVSPVALKGLVERLQRGQLGTDQVRGEWLPTLNWLINQALIAYRAGAEGLAYTFYSPLFNEFLAHTPPATWTPTPPVAPAAPMTPAVYEALTKIEASLLRYLQEHSQTAVSAEQLLAEVWKRPDASSRRVEEAVRRLRLQLDQQSPPVGEIKNERGRGYRFVPAQPTMRSAL